MKSPRWPGAADRSAGPCVAGAARRLRQIFGFVGAPALGGHGQIAPCAAHGVNRCCKLDSHLAPASQRQAAGQLPPGARAGRRHSHSASSPAAPISIHSRVQKRPSSRATGPRPNACRMPSSTDTPSRTASQQPAFRVEQQARGFHRARRRDLVEQLLEHLIDVQPFDVQFRRDAHAVAQHRQGAALDVVRDDELAATQQRAGAGAAHQRDGGARPGAEGQARPGAGAAQPAARRSRAPDRPAADRWQMRLQAPARPSLATRCAAAAHRACRRGSSG